MSDLEFGYDDQVKSPKHYVTPGGVECIVAIKSMLSPEEYLGYLRGSVIKYLWRFRKKGRNTDLSKCSVYLTWLRAAYMGFAEKGDETNEKLFSGGKSCTC